MTELGSESVIHQRHTRRMDIVTSYKTTDLLSLIAKSSNTENSSFLQVSIQVRKGGQWSQPVGWLIILLLHYIIIHIFICLSPKEDSSL